MAVTEEISAMKVNLGLDDGTTAQGNVKVVKVSMGKMKVDANIDINKIANVAEAMAPVMNKSIVQIVKSPEFMLSID